MIKINLAKVKKEKPRRIDTSPRRIRLGDFFKAGGEYYAGAILWLAVVALLAYQWKINREKESIRAEINRLNPERAKLQTQAQKVIEERKRIEENIKRIRAEITEMDRSVQVLTNLKSKYADFNNTLIAHTSKVVGPSWINFYEQKLDLENNVIVSTIELSSFHSNSILAFAKSLGSMDNSIKVYPNFTTGWRTERGLVYNRSSFTVVKPLGEGRHE